MTNASPADAARISKSRPEADSADERHALLANADLVVAALGSIEPGFGFDSNSVKWLEAYIENLRGAGELRDETAAHKLITMFGSYLGECIARGYDGHWTQVDGTWCVALGPRNVVFPFEKVAKQIQFGLAEGIGGLFSSIPVVVPGCGRLDHPTRWNIFD